MTFNHNLPIVYDKFVDFYKIILKIMKTIICD